MQSGKCSTRSGKKKKTCLALEPDRGLELPTDAPRIQLPRFFVVAIDTAALDFNARKAGSRIFNLTLRQLHDHLHKLWEVTRQIRVMRDVFRYQKNLLKFFFDLPRTHLLSRV